MKRYGIALELAHVPPLDPDFLPLHRFNQAFLAEAREPVSIAVERPGGQISVCRTFIRSVGAIGAADRFYIDRLVKTLLWMKGGFRIYVSGSRAVFHFLGETYGPGGKRAFDSAYMADVFEHPFEVVWAPEPPAEREIPRATGGHLDGCRIGFDAGGSDRKVSAVMNGQTVYAEEVVWFPKLNADPEYHYAGILEALRSAAAHLPRVDAVGVSSAGVYRDNRTMNASLFRQVPRDVFEAKGRDIYIRAITDTFGEIPFEVVNDGDVTALAGAMSLKDTNVLGIAMGTSEAGGFVDSQGQITGWLNELAYVPVDAGAAAASDEWSGDIGCGEKYFSQESIIRLAPRAGIPLDAHLSPAEKLAAVQKRMEEGSDAAAQIYETIGVYLGHTLPYYHALYGCKHVLLLGRVMSGRGGDRIAETADLVLRDEYPGVHAALTLELPDERFRRIGQSMAAASLPATKGEVGSIC